MWPSDKNWYQDFIDANDALEEIRELHCPIQPPEGMALMFSTKGTQYCEECTPEDPFYAVEWPCATRLIVDKVYK